MTTLLALGPHRCQDAGQGTPKYIWFWHPSTAACSRGLPAPPAALQANPSPVQCREQEASQRPEALSWVPRFPLAQLHRAAIWLMSDIVSNLALSTPAICFAFTPCYSIPPALHCTRLLNSFVCICPLRTRADSHHRSRQDVQQGERATQRGLFSKTIKIKKAYNLH